MTDLTKLSMDELQALFVSDGQQLTILANERQAILAEQEARKKVASVQAKLDGLTAEEKEALRAALGPAAFSQPADAPADQGPS